jgi:hypothetical protein
MLWHKRHETRENAASADGTEPVRQRILEEFFFQGNEKENRYPENQPAEESYSKR